MNSSGSQPGLDLPKPDPGAVDDSGQNQPRGTVEPVTASPQTPQPAGIQQDNQAGVPHSPPPLAGSDSPVSAQDDSADTPLAAEDSDLIEQEWVHKAKAIVNNTRDDPHQQNRQINKFKASYIKKRYNREVKIDEEQ